MSANQAANAAPAPAPVPAANAAPAAAAQVFSPQVVAKKSQRVIDTARNTTLYNYLEQNHLGHLAAAFVGPGDTKGKTAVAAHNALRDVDGQLQANKTEIAALKTEVSQLKGGDEEEPEIKAEVKDEE